MYYFSIPSDFNIQTLKKIEAINSKSRKFNVSEVYGQITEGEFISSGRMVSMLPQMSLASLKNYMMYCKKYNINFNYVFNPSCMGNKEFCKENQKKIKAFICTLYDMGINSFTIAMPSIIELINGLGLDINIKASAICEIDSPSKALFYKKLGAKRMVVEPDMTRDFKTIKNMCHVFGRGVEIIVNNVCVKHCAYKKFHYNHEAHCHESSIKQDINNYYFHRCSMQKASAIHNVLRLNWIRPEDLKYYYASGIECFKIQGRHNSDGDNLLKTIQHYFDEDYEGDLMALITLFSPYNAFQLKVNNKKLDGYIEKFYNHPSFCNDICERCHYCLDYAHKCMDIEKALETNQKTINFYTQYDEYSMKPCVNEGE
ncbi:U32 family peptidase [Vallitalea pronyensis]|uniref:U32 family peptidase n=1 Tax=Vallitalea pronyensis TaxID=1348613 RepID=A0A8J8MHW4_9FIRM|nr:U32 family peptidase [Vallitalea pronyensis]QUI21831.1 U32 family peptidase [Vallitalea pronyensis]